MSNDIIGIRHVSNDMGAHMSYDSRKAFWIITEKLQAFCIITWEILSLLYYHLTNPKHSVFLLEKPQALCVITW